MRSPWLLLLLASAATVGCNGALASSSSGAAEQSGGPQPATSSSPGATPLPSGPADGTSTVLARLDGSYIESMTADATMLYLGRDGQIMAVPKAGGVVKMIFEEPPEARSATAGIAVDDTHVYFSGSGGRVVSRVPKGGGARELLASNVDYPQQIAIDSTHVYVAMNGTGPAGTTPTGAIVRIPKAGGPIEELAKNQHFPGAIAIDGANVYFANSADDYLAGPDGSIARVPKTGGAVEVLTNEVVGEAKQIVIAGGSLFYVGRQSHALTRVPLTGGSPTTALPSSLELTLATDGSSLFATSFAVGSKDATLLRLDLAGRTLGTLAAWSYPDAKPPQVYPGVAFAYGALVSVIDATHVYWADYEDDSRGGTRISVRSASH